MMRTKTLGGGRRKPLRSSFLLSLPTIQEEYAAAEYDTSRDGDLRGVPMANGDDLHSSRSPRDVLNHESINLWERNVCICCNKDEGVLVCSGSGCLVSLHAACTIPEPKFDDLGNFYCPYCWYKRVVDESRRKVRKEEGAFLSFSAKGVDASDKSVQKDGDGLSLGPENRQDIEGVNIQPLWPKRDRSRKLQEASVDRCEISLEDQADGDGDFRPFGEEEIPVVTNLGSMNQEKFDEPNKAATDEIIFLPWKESTEMEDSRHNVENVLEIREEAEHLSALHMVKCTDIAFAEGTQENVESTEMVESRRNVENVHEIREEAEHLSPLPMVKCTDGHSPDIAFAEGTQENVVKSSKKGRMTNKGRIPHREQRVPVAGNLDSEDISRRKIWRGKRKVQKVEHSQNDASVNHNTKGGSPGEVASPIKLREPPSFPNNNWSSLIRRNKLFWTDEEQKALQDGVLKFSKGGLTIPWRKILESGCHVFHKTRTPVDLKDKWRNMIRYGSEHALTTKGGGIEGAKIGWDGTL